MTNPTDPRSCSYCGDDGPPCAMCGCDTPPKDEPRIVCNSCGETPTDIRRHVCAKRRDDYLDIDSFTPEERKRIEAIGAALLPRCKPEPANSGGSGSPGVWNPRTRQTEPAQAEARDLIFDADETPFTQILARLNRVERERDELRDGLEHTNAVNSDEKHRLNKELFSARNERDQLQRDLEAAKAEACEARELVGAAERKGYAARETEHAADRRMLAAANERIAQLVAEKTAIAGKLMKDLPEYLALEEERDALAAEVGRLSRVSDSDKGRLRALSERADAAEKRIADLEAANRLLAIAGAGRTDAQEKLALAREGLERIRDMEFDRDSTGRSFQLIARETLTGLGEANETK